MLTHIIDGTIEKGKRYLIQPNHIYTGDHLWEAFGNSEAETSARHIVRLCQERGGWLPFTKEEIDAFSGHDFCFNHLHIHGPDKDEYNLVGFIDGQFYVTHEFIVDCFKSSPAPGCISAQETAGHEN